MKKIMHILADETGGKSYKAHKYGLDRDERPYIDYGEDNHIWKKSGETISRKKPIDLSEKSKSVASANDPLLTFFLDGSDMYLKKWTLTPS